MRRSTPASTGLGYTFCGRLARGRRGFFVSFSPAVSPKATQGDRRTDQGLADSTVAVQRTLPDSPGPSTPGSEAGSNYYGAFYRSEFVCQLAARHRRTPRPPWAMQKFKRLARPYPPELVGMAGSSFMPVILRRLNCVRYSGVVTPWCTGIDAGCRGAGMTVQTVPGNGTPKRAGGGGSLPPLTRQSRRSPTGPSTNPRTGCGS